MVCADEGAREDAVAFKEYVSRLDTAIKRNITASGSLVLAACGEMANQLEFALGV